MREETGAPGGNPRSQVEIDLNSIHIHTAFVVEVEGVIEVHYASLTSQVVQKTAFYLDGHPSRYQPCPKGLTLVNRREPVFCLWLEPYPFSFPKQFTHTYWLISWYSNLQVIMQSREQKLFNLTKKKVKYQ